jgi:L-ascorbate metabolism protein UlaG (beta-lactamase superfamily)
MGDTGLFGDLRLINTIYKPDLVLIPIGGNYTMDPKIAAEAVRMLQPKYVIPMHYGTFPPLVGTPEELIASLGSSSNQMRVIVMKPGDKQSF